MITNHKTEKFQIQTTEIAPDFDDASRLEINFTATLTPAYIADLDYDADYLEFLFDDDDPTDIVWQFNVASRHHDFLYCMLDQSGDIIDDLSHAVAQFGQPIIDYIADACRTLNIPFYPND